LSSEDSLKDARRLPLPDYQRQLLVRQLEGARQEDLFAKNRSYWNGAVPRQRDPDWSCGWLGNTE